MLLFDRSELSVSKSQLQSLEESVQNLKDSNKNLELQIGEKNKEIELNKTAMNEKSDRAAKVSIHMNTKYSRTKSITFQQVIKKIQNKIFITN